MENGKGITMIQKLGRDLQVGDVVRVWWAPGTDRITKLVPYKGKLSHLWNGEARLADFAMSRVGMTIEPDAAFEVV